jgi:hypothetical protein
LFNSKTLLFTMKKYMLSFSAIAVVAVAVVAGVACKKNQGFDARGTVAGPPFLGTVTLPNVISSNRTLGSLDTLYILNGKTYVTNNATLTVGPGVRVEGIKRSTADSASALIITRGSKLNAQGDSETPIVFSSHEASPAPGDWGGIVLLGRAPLNRADTTIEGIGEPSLPVGVDIQYGGNNCSDNSGILQFVRIEYAGAVITEGNELNGLTCGGVGNGTVLQYIQTAFGADDGFEFFGGCVNADHLISYGNNDDDFDFDFGWKGKIQFAVGSRIPNVAYLNTNSNGIECDNSPIGVLPVPLPRTNDSALGSVLTNFTLIGRNNCSGQVFNGAFFRNRTKITFRNSIIMDFPTGLRVDSTTDDFAPGFRNNLVHAVAAESVQATSGAPALPALITFNDTTSVGCVGGFGNSFIGLTAPYSSTPDFTPVAGSRATVGANFTGFTGVEVVSYRGAFAAGDDWTLGWTRWNF